MFLFVYFLVVNFCKMCIDEWYKVVNFIIFYCNGIVNL